MAKVGGTADKAEAYIRSTLPHVQAKYCHKSLGTKIYIQKIGDIKHYSGESLQATAAKLECDSVFSSNKFRYVFIWNAVKRLRSSKVDRESNNDNSDGEDCESVLEMDEEGKFFSISHWQ